MVRHVHDTEEEQGDIFPDDGWVRSTTNVTKPSPIVTVTRSEDTSAESVGSWIKDAMLLTSRCRHRSCPHVTWLHSTTTFNLTTTNTTNIATTTMTTTRRMTTTSEIK